MAFGRESVLGASSMMGTKKSLNRVYMQIMGPSFSAHTDVAARELKLEESFHDLTLRYMQAQFIQSAQTAGCNARHNLEQRFARWLLLCAERVEAKTGLAIKMIGVEGEMLPSTPGMSLRISSSRNQYLSRTE